jgi:hypothetical protein
MKAIAAFEPSQDVAWCGVVTTIVQCSVTMFSTLRVAREVTGLSRDFRVRGVFLSLLEL